MELLCNMPIIHFKPVEGKKKTQKGMYTCPLYMYPVVAHASDHYSCIHSIFVVVTFSSDFWTKRVVALLLSHAG